MFPADWNKYLRNFLIEKNTDNFPAAIAIRLFISLAIWIRLQARKGSTYNITSSHSSPWCHF